MAYHDVSQALRFGEALTRAESAVLLLHGRGSSAEDIAGLSDVIPSEGVAFMAPSATNGTWYPQRFFAPMVQNEPWLSSALDVVDQLIREIVAAGVGRSRVALVGFSQGACLALEYVARHPARYRFVAGLSGALIGPLDTPRPEVDLKQTPILLGCAEFDAHIPREHVEHSAKTLAGFDAAVTKQIYPGGAHTVFPQEVAWLKSQAL